MIKHQQIGQLFDESGEIVCFSMTNVRKLAAKLQVSEDVVIERLGGVRCEFAEGGHFGMDQVHAVDGDGKVYPVVMMGAPLGIKRFLREDEMSLSEFVQQHPRHAEVGTGESFNEAVWMEIVREYREKILVG